MNCDQFQERLDDCLDLRESPADDWHLTEHARHCQRCQRVLQVWQAADLCFNSHADGAVESAGGQTVVLPTQTAPNRQRTVLVMSAAAMLLIAALPLATRLWGPAGATLTASGQPGSLEQISSDFAAGDSAPAPSDLAAAGHRYPGDHAFAGHRATSNLQLTDPHWWNGSLQEGRQWVDQAYPTVQPAVDSMGERVATIGRRFKRVMASILLQPDPQSEQESPHANGQAPYSPQRRPLIFGDELDPRFVA